MSWTMAGQWLDNELDDGLDNGDNRPGACQAG